MSHTLKFRHRRKGVHRDSQRIYAAMKADVEVFQTGYPDGMPQDQAINCLAKLLSDNWQPLAAKANQVERAAGQVKVEYSEFGTARNEAVYLYDHWNQGTCCSVKVLPMEEAANA